MADQITFAETLGDDTFARAVWAALCEDRSIFEKLGITATSPRDQILTVECKIDGIEVSLRDYFERLEKQMTWRVEHRAKEMLSEYLRERDVHSRLDTMNTILEKFEKQLISEFFPNDPEFSNDD